MKRGRLGNDVAYLCVACNIRMHESKRVEHNTIRCRAIKSQKLWLKREAYAREVAEKWEEEERAALDSIRPLLCKQRRLNMENNEMASRREIELMQMEIWNCQKALLESLLAGSAVEVSQHALDEALFAARDVIGDDSDGPRILRRKKRVLRHRYTWWETMLFTSPIAR